MTYPQTIRYLETQPLALALWWFIENITELDPRRTELFLYLRERVRKETLNAQSSQCQAKEPGTTLEELTDAHSVLVERVNHCNIRAQRAQEEIKALREALDALLRTVQYHVNNHHLL